MRFEDSCVFVPFQQSLDIFEVIDVSIEVLFSYCLRIFIIFNSEQEEVILIQFIKNHIILLKLCLVSWIRNTGANACGCDTRHCNQDFFLNSQSSVILGISCNTNPTFAWFVEGTCGGFLWLT